ncbi:MAG: hypothetical protein JXR95_08370 [Deltaproteobacteria bacterium]|nr:hypothetical protein [Deltaproteobacteria bacterium]
MNNLFVLHSYHGMSDGKTMLFSVLLIIIFSIFFPLFTWRFIRDIKNLKLFNSSVDDIRKKIDLQDRVFGWFVAMSMLSFVLVAALSVVIK